MNKNIEIESLDFEWEAKSGKVYKLDKTELIKQINHIINQAKYAISQEVIEDNIMFDWDKEPDMSTEEGLNKYFAKEFYIKYEGNPSMNGGHFNFRNGDKLLGDFRSAITDTLSCDKLLRTWGYGRNQLGYKHVKEDIETSTKFVDFLIKYNIVDLDSCIIDNGDYHNNTKGRNLMTYGTAILMYLVRSMNFDKANDFLNYADYKFKSAVASRLDDYYCKWEIISKEFVDDLHPEERKDWCTSLKTNIEMFVYLSKLCPTAFLDEYKDNRSYMSTYEEFKDGHFNKTLKIINNKGKLTIKENWFEKLKEYFLIKIK